MDDLTKTSIITIPNNDPEWQKIIYDFFGTPRATLGNSQKSKDECLGFVASLIYGTDPLADERLSLNEEMLSEITTPFTPRREDRLPYLYITLGLINIPPKELDQFFKTANGQALHRYLVELLSADDTNSMRQFIGDK
jgi:hypothetical protein